MRSGTSAAVRLIRIAAHNPEAELDKFLQATSMSFDGERLLAVDFIFCEYWREEKNTLALTALFYVQDNASSISIAVLRTEQFDHNEKIWRNSAESLIDLLNALPVTIFPLDGALPLQSISIPKPWGQEIWYTGIEQRGVAEIGTAGSSVPLPWLLAIAPQRLTRGALQPILLKILDPLPEPVFGDLYFELHREKQEVYIVTAVDQRAWIDGVGAIRFGFNAEKRKEYVSDAAFIEAYLSAVRAYRVVRKQIDTQIDECRKRDGVELYAPVSAAMLVQWLRDVAPALQHNEIALRTRMEAFTGLMPLRVGDVVKVPCLLPHSLQHGVRTVEFQTPVYERLILSFGQKVLTQTEWDTDEAAGVLKLDPEPPADFPLIAEGNGWKEEQIAQFDDFEVRRICLQPHTERLLGHNRSYGLGMVVGQMLSLGERCIRPDEAVLLTTNFCPVALANNGDEIAYFLLALPLS